MSKAFSVFNQSIRFTRDLNSIYNYISSNAPLLDASQLLRSEYALIISCLDKYIHDFTRERLVQIFMSGSTDITSTLQLSLDKVINIVNEPDPIKREILVDSYIQNKMSTSSFQSPKNIDSAFSLIGTQKIWTAISPSMGISAQTIIAQLKILVSRRNKIVHEADIDTLTGDHTDIDLETVDYCYKFVCNLVNAIESNI